MGKKPKNYKLIFTISNLLSFLRIVLLIPIVYLLQLSMNDPQLSLYVVGLMFVAGITDVLDGKLARALNQETELGQIIDPLADKAAVFVVIGYLGLFRPDFPLWFLIVAVVRDLIILLGGIYVKKKYDYLFVSNMLGKVTITVMFVSVLIYVLKDLFGLQLLFEISIFLSLGLIVISFLSYLKRFLDFIKQTEAS